ncbi:tetratricopeptide repeat protein [Piscinibacter sakaiensis]|uniref:Ancillary SecYEG translocon subunit n=1 Tax=Piscinibacter sakaiensis TaxID=1547922 RepID=A0A0K8P6Y5_PISS1|nr:tetratricopeptide repeat protein [Piscinibacter sakaiensis]GAP38418.1 Mlr7403 protein [Piscinibacter sakaiensis]
MASHLDLEEQEQLDQLKAFWRQYGNLITWALIAALGTVAAWNGWNWWQREQAISASGMYDELERAGQAGDAVTAARIFEDLKSRYPRTTYARQGGLLVAKVQVDKGQAEPARAALAWVAEQGGDAELRSLARLRLAALLFEDKKYDEALKQLDAVDSPGFEALVADRRGDVLAAQGKPADAISAYRSAWKGLEERLTYRRLVEAKLASLGATTEATP